MNNTLYYVYLHKRLSDGLIFYVGKGKGDRAYRKNGRNNHWQKTVDKHGYCIDILFDNLTEEEAFQIEIDTILELKYFGFSLVNYTNGGDGTSGYRFSEESKLKMSENNVFRNKDFIEKNKILKTGKKLSESHKEKIIKGLIGRKQSKETIEKRMLYVRGVKRSEESKLKMSIAQKNRPPVTQETKNRMSKSRIGRVISKESREKISESNSKIVSCSNNMTFKSLTQAVEWLKSIGKENAVVGNIGACCKGRLNSAYGFTWKYGLIN